jgi:hypothetical protein
MLNTFPLTGIHDHPRTPPLPAAQHDLDDLHCSTHVLKELGALTMGYTNIEANGLIGADKDSSPSHELYDTSLTSATNLELTLINFATALSSTTDLGLVTLLV